MKKADYDQFIGSYPDVYEEGFCEHLIKEFERLSTLGASSDRIKSENHYPNTKNDIHIFVDVKRWPMEDFKGESVVDVFFRGLQATFDDYVKKYSPLHRIKMATRNMKLQKTGNQAGYHVWHFENTNMDTANRVLTYMLYLNTLPKESCGETEFLFQEKRINPVGNSMLLWPAGYTHVHRGNAVYGQTPKYVVTGWFDYE